MNKGKAYLFAVAGAALWGIIGLFVQFLYDAGFTPWEVVAIRVIFSALLLVSFLLVAAPVRLKIHLKDSGYFIGTGILSIVFFNWAYFTVIDEASLSLAVVLLYTGPLFVTLMSRLIFKEWLTPRKIAALLCTLIGCVLVVGLLPHFATSITWLALFIGIGSGFCYALYSIFGKSVSRKYSALTITTYSFVFASLFMIPAGGLWDERALFTNPDVWLYAFGLALFPTVIAYICYTYGLTYIESSRASILSTVEPVVAIVIGVSVFGDRLSVWQMVGIGLVLMSVILAAERVKSNDNNQHFQDKIDVAN